MEPAQKDVWTVKRLHEWTRDFLKRQGSESPEIETQILMAQALQCRRVELFTRYEQEVSEEKRARLRELIQQRAKGCPVAYLVGHKEFYSLRFEVSPAVLIPRDDSEWIVQECLRMSKGQGAVRVLDLGTGSGNLAVAIARQNKDASVVAVDVSQEALAIAQKNAEAHQVFDRIEFLHGDLFDALRSARSFQFIVSNPPYVKTGELSTLQTEVRDFEPRLALDGGPDGLDVFDRIIAGADNFLEDEGYLILEIGEDQESEARTRIEALGCYKLNPTIRDAKGLSRVLVAKYQA